MSGVVASDKQRARRQLFWEAVEYAKWIFADEKRKRTFQQALPEMRSRRVFQAAIQLYMDRHGNRQWLRKQLAVQAMERVQQGDRQFASNKACRAIGKE